MEKNLRIAYLYDFYGDILSEKQRFAIEQYYNDDLSLSEIAEQMGISRQGVRDLLKRSENVLFELEEKLHLAERFESILDEIKSIRCNAAAIAELSKENDDVRTRAETITRSADKLSESF